MNITDLRTHKFSVPTGQQVRDPATGELLWQYDPEVPPEWDATACCGVQNRGAAVWKGRVYAGTLDGRLIALNA